MASPQQSRIQSYLEKNKIGPLFEELMTKLITETPDRPIPFLIDHLQTKQDSPGKLHRALSGSAALWAQSSPESKNPRREHGNHEKPWQIHPKKPKKIKERLGCFQPLSSLARIQVLAAVDRVPVLGLEGEPGL